MWEVLAVILTVLGSLFVYLTNKNQNLISKKLPKSWRLISSILLLCALFSWFQVYVFSAALFLWVFVALTAFICVPLLSLFSFTDKNSQSATGKR